MEFCILHKTLPFSMLCISCEQRLCSECATSHTLLTNCKVRPLGDISDEIKSRLRNFAVSLENVDHKVSALSHKCSEEKQSLVRDSNFNRTQIEKDYERLCKELKHERSTLVEKVIQTEMSKMEQVIYVRQQVMKAQRAIKNLKQRLKDASSEGEISELEKLKEIDNLAEGIGENLNEMEENWTREPLELSLTKVFNSGEFGILSLRTFIGGVIISPDQLVNIFDSRRENGGVLFICIDNKEHKNEFWRHLLKIEDHCYPVVMSSKSIFCDKQQILIAVGKTVYSLRPHFKGSYDGVESLKTIALNDLNDSEWITSITTHQPSFDPSYEFLISVSNSNVLREYEMSGKALRRVKMTYSDTSIIYASYVYSMFGVIAQGRNDVTLFTAGNTVELCGFLKAPSCSHCRLLPKVVIWTGFRWLVLWISDDQENEWKVVRYIATGEQMKVCDEGISQCTAEVPVNITRSRNTGYVSFRDGNFRTFQY